MEVPLYTRNITSIHAHRTSLYVLLFSITVYVLLFSITVYVLLFSNTYTVKKRSAVGTLKRSHIAHFLHFILQCSQASFCNAYYLWFRQHIHFFSFEFGTPAYIRVYIHH